MTERRDISLAIIANTRRYQEEMAKIPGMTDQAAAKAASAMVKQEIKAQQDLERIRKKAIADRLREDKAAEKKRLRMIESTNREIEGSYRDQFGAIKGLSGAAFGGIAGDAFDLGEVLIGVSGKMALVGAGLAALSIAPEIIRGIHEFADGADETAEAMGRVLTPEEKERFDQFQLTTSQLTAEFNALKLEAQLLAGDAMIELLRVFREVLSAINNITNSAAVTYISELGDAIGDAKDEFMEALGPLGDIATELANFPFLLRRVAQAFADPEADFAPMAAAVLKVKDATDDTADSAKKLGTVYHDESQSVEDAFEKIAAGRDELARMEQEALEDIARGRNEEARADRARYQAQIEQGRQAAAAAIASIDEEMEAERQQQILQGEMAERKRQLHEEDQKRLEEQREQLKQTMLSLADLQATAVGAAASFTEIKFENLREGATDAVGRTRALRGEINDLKADLETASEAERKQIENSIALKEDELVQAKSRSDQAKKDARKAFREAKALRISETIISGAAAAVRAIAELGFPAGSVAAASIAITTSANVAKIRAQKPPKFHDGGLMPDESPAMLRKGEAVLNERATQRLGRRAIEALNRDEPIGNINVFLGEDLLRTQRLTRSSRGRAHSAIGARSPYLGR